MTRPNFQRGNVGCAAVAGRCGRPFKRRGICAEVLPVFTQDLPSAAHARHDTVPTSRGRPEHRAGAHVRRFRPLARPSRGARTQPAQAQQDGPSRKIWQREQARAEELLPSNQGNHNRNESGRTRLAPRAKGVTIELSVSAGQRGEKSYSRYSLGPLENAQAFSRGHP